MDTLSAILWKRIDGNVGSLHFICVMLVLIVLIVAIRQDEYGPRTPGLANPFGYVRDAHSRCLQSVFCAFQWPGEAHSVVLCLPAIWLVAI